MFLFTVHDKKFHELCSIYKDFTEIGVLCLKIAVKNRQKSRVDIRADLGFSEGGD